MSKYLLTTIPLAIFLLTMVPMVHVQAQQQYCSVCPNGQPPVTTQVMPQQQYIQPQQQVLAATPPPISLQNITQAITTALDPIQKHLAVQDAEIANITTIITKLQTQPAPTPQPLPPPPTNQTLPPPPPPGEQQSSGSSCPSQQQQQQSSCPFSQGPGFYQGGGFQGGPGFYQGGFPHNFGGNGGHHSGGHHSS